MVAGILKKLKPGSWHTFRQFASFALVGLSGVLVGLGVLNLCMLVAASFPLANGVAFLVAVTWNFWLNRRFTFDPTDKPLPQQWLRFVAVCAGGAVVNWAVSLGLYYGVAFFQQHYNCAALMGVAVASLFNFIAARSCVFNPHSITGCARTENRRRTRWSAAPISKETR